MTTDMYTRPSRAEIAARVNGQLPGAETAPTARKDPPRPPTNVGDAFLANAAAALRRKGWSYSELARRSGITPGGISKIMGANAARTRLTLTAAAAIADALGISLDYMTRPYVCRTCKGQPPYGFNCRECGAEGTGL